MYASHGRAVFPIHSVRFRGNGVLCMCEDSECRNEGKHPLTPHGVLDATTDARRIREWWRRWEDANVGIATGAVSGIFVLDSDPRHGGDESLAHLIERHGPLAETVTVATGGGGHHYYFLHPGVGVGNSAGALGKGLDIRGDGGYVVAVPSVHKSGESYEWAPGFSPDSLSLAAAPPWLLTLIAGRAGNGAGRRGRRNPKGWISRALAAMVEGNRNTTLIRIAGALRRPGFAVEDVDALLLPHARAAGIEDEELSRIVESAGRYEAAIDSLGRRIRVIKGDPS
jgi:hypothetical protein